MTRWMTGLLVALAGFAPAPGFAQGPWQAPGAHPAGFHQQFAPGPIDPQLWHNGPPCPDGSYQATMAQLVPYNMDACYDTDTPFDMLVSETLARTTIRLDYLMWSITGPDRTLLGAPIVGDADLSGANRLNRLPAVDPVTGPYPQTAVIVPRVGSHEHENLNGIRGSIVVPTLVGALEANVWTLEQTSASARVDPLIDPSAGLPTTLIGAVTLLNNGVRSDTSMLLFSESYSARLKTTLFGTEGNWVFRPLVDNVGIEVSPLVGFRYLRMHNGMRISGAHRPDPDNEPDLVLNHLIDSTARNDVFGPQVGLRFATQISRLDLGTDLKFMTGINQLNDSLRTQQIFAIDEDPTRDESTRTRFAPVFNLAVYGRLHVTDHFNLIAGYDLLLGGGFSKAYNNVNYNLPANVNNGPDFTLKHNLSKFWAHGLTVGGEFHYR